MRLGGIAASIASFALAFIVDVIHFNHNEGIWQCLR
jgi:hypothetical protein